MVSTEHLPVGSKIETSPIPNMPLDSQRNLSAMHSQPQSSTPIEMAEIAKSEQDQSFASMRHEGNGHVAISEGSDYNRQKANQRDEQTSVQPTSRQNGSQRLPALTAPPAVSEDPIYTKESSQTREVAWPAIGPATDKLSPPPKETEVEGPVLHITLLLTTGARHPFRLDQRYLKKRNVEVEDNNPINMSLYKLKELILRDWREEWEAKPSSPESIRLISMGKLLTDKSKLADFGFKDGGAPSIIHMTIKPQDIIDEEDANKNPRDRDGSERSPGCRCTIM